jgi:hypothetical protein
MKSLFFISVFTLLFAGCAINPPASLVSWDGSNGKVRQGVWGAIHEPKVDPAMAKIMTLKCPNGFTVTKEGSDITGSYPAPVEAKFKEFKCK